MNVNRKQTNLNFVRQDMNVNRKQTNPNFVRQDMNVNRKQTNPNFVRQDINRNMLIPFGKKIYYSDLSIDIYLLTEKI